MTGTFDESKHPRAYHGRFTENGDFEFKDLQHDVAGRELPLLVVSDPALQEKAKEIGLAAAQTARELGFDPGMIQVTDKEYPFEINGHAHMAAGTADRVSGIVTLYAKQLDVASTGYVTAHEIEHQKFNAFQRDYEAEAARVKDLPQVDVKVNTGDPAAQHPDAAPGSFTVKRDAMKPDGTLREPYDKQFPVYTAYTNLISGTNQKPDLWASMAKEDGCTPYSKEWWDAVKAGKATYDKGYHETLAEMAALHYKEAAAYNSEVKMFGKAKAKELAVARGSPLAPPTLKPLTMAQRAAGLDRVKDGFLTNKPSKDWLALYKAVNDHWNKRTK